MRTDLHRLEWETRLLARSLANHRFAADSEWRVEVRFAPVATAILCSPDGVEVFGPDVADRLVERPLCDEEPSVDVRHRVDAYRDAESSVYSQAVTPLIAAPATRTPTGQQVQQVQLPDGITVTRLTGAEQDLELISIEDPTRPGVRSRGSARGLDGPLRLTVLAPQPARGALLTPARSAPAEDPARREAPRA